MKIMSVHLRPYKYNGGGNDVIVILANRDQEEEWLFEEREGVYRAQCGDFVRFFSWTGPNNEGGFCGAKYPITMQDGTSRTLLGPWSSRAGAVNRVFHDREPVVDCVDNKQCTLVCAKAALERFGIKFKLAEDNGWDMRYDPIP